MKVVLLLTFAGFALCGPMTVERTRYDGYKVLDIIPDTKAQQEFVHNLQNDIELDFLREKHILGQPTSVMVPPHRLDDLGLKLSENGITYRITRENVQSHLDAEVARFAKRDIEGFEFDYNDYNRYEEVMEELENISTRCSSGFSCFTYNAGYSDEGREIRILKIERIDGVRQKQGRTSIWLDATCHAREWITTSTVMSIANRLASNYDTDSTVQWLLNNYDWYIMPVMNPDGYIYTWDVDRNWRKTRSVNENSECYGVDLNRNFDHFWGKNGASPLPCTSNYMGPAPNSTSEARTVQNELNRLSDELLATVAFHSTGEMWLHPWGYREEDDECAYAPGHDELLRVANAAADATQETHGTVWTRGNSCETIYAHSGTMGDYAHGVCGIPYPYTPELRGPGHDPPASEIEPSYQEMWNGMVAMVQAIENPETQI